MLLNYGKLAKCLRFMYMIVNISEIRKFVQKNKLRKLRLLQKYNNLYLLYENIRLFLRRVNSLLKIFRLQYRCI